MVAIGRVSHPPKAGPLTPPCGAWVRLLPCPDWSKISLIRQVVLAQNASWAAASAYPPASGVGSARGRTTPMFLVRWSDRRMTWYSGPLEAAYSARVVLCAATQGVPPAADMSHRPC